MAHFSFLNVSCFFLLPFSFFSSSFLPLFFFLLLFRKFLFFFFFIKIEKYLYYIKLTRRHEMSRINDWAVLATLDLYCRSQYDYRVAIIRIHNRKPKRIKQSNYDGLLTRRSRCIYLDIKKKSLSEYVCIV